MIKEVSIAAATAALGYDLLTNEPDFKTSSQPRRLSAASVAGSAAALDSTVQIKAGPVVVCTLFNARTSQVTNDDLVPVDVYLPPGSPLSAIVSKAPATNPLNARLVVDDLA